MKFLRRQREVILWVFLLTVVCLVASVWAQKQNNLKQNSSLVNDLGSAKKVKLLENRAVNFWQAMVKGNLEKAYEYYDPFLRARMDVHEFIVKHGAVKYDSFAIDNIEVKGNVGIVKLTVTYHVPKMKVFQKELSMPKTTRTFEEKWLYVYDNWYKEYFLRFFGRGIAFY